jgi:hypothetical protein
MGPCRNLEVAFVQHLGKVWISLPTAITTQDEPRSSASVAIDVLNVTYNCIVPCPAFGGRFCRVGTEICADTSRFHVGTAMIVVYNELILSVAWYNVWKLL